MKQRHSFFVYRTSDKTPIAKIEILGEITGAEQDVVILDSEKEIRAAVTINLQPGYDRKGK